MASLSCPAVPLVNREKEDNVYFCLKNPKLSKLLSRTEISSDNCGQPERFAQASDTCIRRAAKPVDGMNDMQGLYQNSP